MEEKRLKIADFARLVGTSAKTIYEQIKKEKLITVSEVQNGRKTTLISTNDVQIEEFKKIYGNFTVNDGNYEDIVTVNDGEFTVSEVQNTNISESNINLLQELITMNDNLQERLNTVNERLITSESNKMLLEDKAGREGMYLNKINELEKVNNRNNKLLITVIICSLLLMFGLVIMLMYQHFNPKTVIQEKQITKVITVENGKIKSVLTEKK